MPDFSLRPESVMSVIISKLEPYKVYGLDGIPAILFKNKEYPELATVLFNLYNRCFVVSCFLGFWESSAVPVFKNSRDQIFCIINLLFFYLFLTKY